MFYSVDPHMRGRINDAKSYAVPFPLDQPITGAVVALISESKSDMFITGDVFVGSLSWCETFISSEKIFVKLM